MPGGSLLASLIALVAAVGEACQEPPRPDLRADGGGIPAQPGLADASRVDATSSTGGGAVVLDAATDRFDAHASESGAPDARAPVPGIPEASVPQPGDASSPVRDAFAGDAAPDAAHEAGLDAFILGADITWVQADEFWGASYSDGSERDILELLRSHGFNYVRLRLFVDPQAADGYDRERGFGDLAHTIAFGKRIKAAGMGFLLDLHYSDNWADPGKQCVPAAWQKHTSIAQLATALQDYTRDAISALRAAGARPDLVQLGNEITPGLLLHVCDADGLPLRDHTIQGSVSNWANLGALLRAGVSGVRAVDAQIGIVLHIDRCGDKGAYTGAALETSARFITQARAQGVVFEYFGESCYQAYQGDLDSVASTQANWTKTLHGLAERFPDLHFLAAEYGPLQRQVNDVLFGLPQGRGAGTFVWEPTREGDWNRGHALFRAAWPKHTASPDLALYDQMRRDYAARGR